ncbi:hypothetical protein J3R30DRAFT_3403155 [Lentinula aciculospora]|uniref:FAD/NAD(P)-binding domain-containing protein n=1 Tax=Lentinula aciculospora TaxID=153920 RepID=A0A9W9AED6_9AGAR|nr:hypothetical protein J3R30DRAFT_3403155 [Lentinula aciculospora]
MSGQGLGDLRHKGNRQNRPQNLDESVSHTNVQIIHVQALLQLALNAAMLTCSRVLDYHLYNYIQRNHEFAARSKAQSLSTAYQSRVRMHLIVLFTFLLLVVEACNAAQLPLRSADSFEDGKDERTSYQFKWPIHTVAIIGAGAGGLVAHREFARLGYNIRLFERDNVPGGNWHYTEDEVPPDAPIPNVPTTEADFQPHLPPENTRLPYEEIFDSVEREQVFKVKIDHRAPKPIWDKLTATGPKAYQEFRAMPWPEHIPIDVNRSQLQRYVRAFASFHSLNSNDGSASPDTSYNTRVEHVSKRYTTEEGQKLPTGWTLLLRQFIQISQNSYKIRWWEEDFDAIVVASGRFNAPNAPQIPGLSQWAELYPHHITHSRQYRRPEELINQTVLIIGGSVSGTEIAEELDGVARKVFLSVRSNKESAHAESRKMHLTRVPRNVSVIPEIKSFRPLAGSDSGIQSGVVKLYNGTSLQGIDRIILATGYRYCFPFLPQYNNPSLQANETVPVESGKPQPLITDGTHIRSLHLDLFYIEEPTIGFINMNTGIETFLYSEFAASALAKDVHWRRVKLDLAGGGYRPGFMAFGVEKQATMIRYLVGWLNQEAVRYGGHQLDLPSDSRFQISRFWVAARFPDYHDGSEWQPLSAHMHDSEAQLLGFNPKNQKLVEMWSVERDDW